MHRKGIHCGSTAMADVLRARGLALTEPMAFGLGAGCGFSLHEGDKHLEPPQASRFFVGRSATFEQDLCDVLGATLHRREFETGEEAIELLAASREPVLAYTNLAALPYLDARGHWFGHLVVVHPRGAPGFLIADNEREELQPVERTQLARAVCGPSPERSAPVLMWITEVPRAVPADATTLAIRRNAARMRANAAIRAFAEELPALQRRADWPRIARLCAQIIEVRGCGGGLFRRMYASFLREAGREDLAQLADQAADAWSLLARELTVDGVLACDAAERTLWERACDA